MLRLTEEVPRLRCASLGTTGSAYSFPSSSGTVLSLRSSLLIGAASTNDTGSLPGKLSFSALSSLASTSDSAFFFFGYAGRLAAGVGPHRS